MSISLLSLSMGTYFKTSIVRAYTTKQGSVTASSLNVRVSASSSAAKVGTLARGSRLTIIDEVNTASGIWYKVQFSTGSKTVEGYVSKTYIKLNEASNSYTTDASFEAKLSEQGFPESYKTALRELHTKYPNWIFKAQKTGLDWAEVIANESIVGRNLVHRDSITSWKSTAAGAYDWNTGTWVGFDTNAWVAASEGIIRYYMDPRNFMDESYIFQFLDNAYSENGHKKSGLKNLVANSFLDSTDLVGDTNSMTQSNTAQSDGNNITFGNGIISINPPSRSQNPNVSLTSPGYSTQDTDILYSVSEANVVKGPGINMQNSTSTAPDSEDISGSTYVDIIMRAGKISGVNPYVLATMILQEQGSSGSSGLISGNTSPYKGYYNFFNIEAYQKGTQTPVQRGLWWAAQSGSYGRPWNTREKAIVGGATYYGENYVQAGQNTLYLKKFNVLGSNRYKHQYMTNIEGAANEGIKLAKAYTDELKNSTLEFSIPVYNNMPQTPELIPMGNDKPSHSSSSNSNTANNTSTTDNNNNNNTTNNQAQLVGPGANLSSDTKKESNVSLVAP